MTRESLRLIFAGTPEFASRHLEVLLGSQHQIVAVYTQPDRPAGRGKKLQASPVKQLAQEAGLPVLQPPSLRDSEAQAELAAFEADAMVVVAYGLILPSAVLELPRLGCLNVHASLLPRWRGAAPIQRAIEAGDEETGVTIMQMDAGLDTGNMLATTRCPIEPDTTAASLHDTLADLGGPCLLEVLQALPDYQAKARPQDDKLACYASKISKSEAAIDWQQSARALDRAIRAFNPFPVCFSYLGGQRIKVWEASYVETNHDTAPGSIIETGPRGLLVACGEGALLLTQLQFPGARAMPVAELLKSRRALLAPGSQFSGDPNT